MQIIYLVKHAHSVDGREPAREKFASADREAIVEWVRKKVPSHNWDQLAKGESMESHMYDSFYISEISLVDADDLRAAECAREEIAQLDSQISELSALRDAKKKVAL